MGGEEEHAQRMISKAMTNSVFRNAKTVLNLVGAPGRPLEAYLSPSAKEASRVLPSGPRLGTLGRPWEGKHRALVL